MTAASVDWNDVIEINPVLIHRLTTNTALALMVFVDESKVDQVPFHAVLSRACFIGENPSMVTLGRSPALKSMLSMMRLTAPDRRVSLSPAFHLALNKGGLAIAAPTRAFGV